MRLPENIFNPFYLVEEAFSATILFGFPLLIFGFYALYRLHKRQQFYLPDLVYLYVIPFVIPLIIAHISYVFYGTHSWIAYSTVCIITLLNLIYLVTTFYKAKVYRLVSFSLGLFLLLFTFFSILVSIMAIQDNWM